MIRDRGQDFIIDDNSLNLSGGEKRRISIVRTINKGVPIYLFDEPTSELDDENRKKVIDLLKRLSDSYIVIVATHDEELASLGDKVYKIQNGELMRA